MDSTQSRSQDVFLGAKGRSGDKDEKFRECGLGRAAAGECLRGEEQEYGV